MINEFEDFSINYICDTLLLIIILLKVIFFKNSLTRVYKYDCLHNCLFSKDTEPPRVENCVASQIFVSNESQVNGTWQEPDFEDNSGKPVEVCYRDSYSDI